MSDFGADLEKIGYVGQYLTSRSTAVLQRTRVEGAKARLIPRHPSAAFLSSHYEVLSELGGGSFGSVRLVRDKEAGNERVCKVVDTRGMPMEAAELASNEVQLLASLDHPYIVRLYECAEDASLNQLVMVLEHVPGGDCLDLLHTSGGFLDESLVGRLVQQLLVAVAYCHSRDIVHRDIKPENMMVWRAAPWKKWNCKLIDFGIARQMQRSFDTMGTAPYVAPEVISGADSHTNKADIWSVGCTTAELLAGQAPFGKPYDYGGKNEPVFHRIQRYQAFQEIEASLADSVGWNHRSNEAQDFVSSLLRAHPSFRPMARDVLDHIWLEERRPSSPRLTPEMVRSMSSFAQASPLERWCMLLIAVRDDIPDASILQSAFMCLDTDLNGIISKDELLEGVYGSSRCWSVQDTDVSEMFAAADLYQGGGLSFSEFMAACSYNQFRPVQLLADIAFRALDSDRDGLVRMPDIRGMCRECDLRSLASLPQKIPFTADDWRRCVVSSRRGLKQLEEDDAIISCTPQQRPGAGQRGLPFFGLLEDWFGCQPSRGCEPLAAEEDEESGAPHVGGRIFSLDPTAEEAVGV